MSDTIKIQDLPHYTLEDYKHWEGNWELIHGIPYAMSPAPRKSHQRASKKIAYLLDKAMPNCDSCEVFLPIDYVFDEDIVVQPDVSILCGISSDEDQTETPVLVVEILSPSTAMKDPSIKYNLYESSGVKYYWLIEPDKKWVEIYELREGKYVRLESSSMMTFDLGHCQFEFNFQKIW